MIRLPATTIILGRSDLLDYEKRKRTRGREKERVSETDKLNEQLARFTVRSQPGSGDSGYGNTNQALVQHNKDNREEAAAIESSEASNEYEAESPSHEITFSPEDLLSEEEYGYVSVGFEHSPENATHETPRPTSPSKQHDFYYGGFIETASSDLMDDPPESLFSFSHGVSHADDMQPQMLLLHSTYNFRPQTDSVLETNYLVRLFTYPKMLRALQNAVRLLVLHPVSRPVWLTIIPLALSFLNLPDDHHE